MDKNWKFFINKLEEGKEEKLEHNSKILIIDSLNTFLRCFSIINHLNPSGNHIGGLTGFLKSIGFAIRLIQPTKVILVFDGQGSSTNKRYLYPEYKANREITKVKNWGFDSIEEEEESMVNQLERLVDYLNCLPVHTLAIDKVEADDVIGYLVNKSPDTSKITIMSADQDFLQLTSPKVQIYSPTKKRIYGPKEVLKEYGVTSENFIYYKVLMGDKGDNVPGIRGLGKKKIFQLFPELATEKINMDYIKERSNSLKEEKKLFRDIHNFSKQLDINFKLMDLRSPNLPKPDFPTMDEVIETECTELDKRKFLEMYNEDMLGNSIPNPEMWIENNFRYLTAYKK
jgi:5'-3' exonuclease